MPEPRTCVAYVIYEYDPDTGTHFQHLYDLIKAAAEKIDLCVVVERHTKTSALPTYAIAQRFHFPPLRMAELFILLLQERVRGTRFFYVHYSFYGAIASWLITTLFGGKVFYWNCGMPWRYPRSAAVEAVFRFILRHTVLVTGTAGIRDMYAREYGLRAEKSRILPNWITVSRFAGGPEKNEARARLTIPRDIPVVLFVHRMSYRKGSDLLPEITREVRKIHPSAMVIAVGSGAREEEIKAAREPGLRMEGSVSNRELPPYFRAADVFLMPSREEGFAHVLLEAMAAGLPYAATNAGGTREITPPALVPYLIQAEKAAFIGGKISELLSLPEGEIGKIRNEMSVWVRQFDTREVTEKFIELFK